MDPFCGFLPPPCRATRKNCGKQKLRLKWCQDFATENCPWVAAANPPRIWLQTLSYHPREKYMKTLLQLQREIQWKSKSARRRETMSPLFCFRCNRHVPLGFPQAYLELSEHQESVNLLARKEVKKRNSGSPGVEIVKHEAGIWCINTNNIISLFSSETVASYHNPKIILSSQIP